MGRHCCGCRVRSGVGSQAEAQTYGLTVAGLQKGTVSKRAEGLAGLLSLVELGVIEVYPWGAKVDDIEHPDMLVFDLDPGEGVGWDFVLETAFRLT